ncbi:TonB-dependent receptor [Caulobacter soli]|uniref:TonB-dependent receptor n=1 Tax=Caulobacter soli TaxID=2708539 RepID=UPI0013EABADB|nr:TonB-dependent receptor [Caulobacter soli]
MRAIRTTLLMTAVSAFALSAGVAHAAEPDAAAPDQIEELLVTAQKREQKTLDVPIALTAYSGGMLDKLGVQEFDRLSSFVPGFQVQNQSPNNPGFVMRGITSDSGEATVEPRVSVFQDGVSISKSRGSYIELFDIQRIEVAKGPQSTLFGRGALIGAVNVIQNKADPKALDWRVGAELGDHGYGLFEGMANVPLSDTFAVRFSGRYKERDGAVENLLGGRNLGSTDTGAARLSFRWTPTDKLDANLILNYEADHPTGTSFKSNSFNPTDPTTGQVLGDRDPNSGAALQAGPGFNGGAQLGLKRFVQGATALVDYKFNDALKLSSITSARHFQSNETFDPDGFSLPMLTFAEDARSTQYSQEFRLNWDNGGRFSGFGGVSYFNEDAQTAVPSQIDERYALGLITGAMTKPNPQPAAVLTSAAMLQAEVAGLMGLKAGNPLLAYVPGIANNLHVHRESYTNYGKTESFDVYGDGTWRISDQFELSAGLRYTHDDKSSGYASSVQDRSLLGALIALPSVLPTLSPTQQVQFIQALAAPGAAGIPTSAAYPIPMFGIVSQPTRNNGDIFSKDFSDEGLTWRLVGRYKPNADTSVYASYARGRRPEVMSTGQPAAPGGAAKFTPVDAETVDSYEVGAKTRTLGGRLGLEGAVYAYNYDNFQTTILVNTKPTTTNAGKAKAYGFEGQATWQAASFAELFATYAYSHGRFDTGLYDGNRFRLSPDNKASFGATFSAEALNGRFSFTPLYTWQSKVFFSDDNDIAALQVSNLLPDTAVDEFQKSYGLVDLRLEYQPSFANWKVGAFVTNATDKKYIKDAGNTGDAFGIPTFIAGNPRYYGVTFSLRR